MIEKNPRNSEAYNKIGEHFLALNDQEKASSYLYKAYRIAPTNAEVLNNLGLLHMN